MSQIYEKIAIISNRTITEDLYNTSLMGAVLTKYGVEKNATFFTTLSNQKEEEKKEEKKNKDLFMKSLFPNEKYNILPLDQGDKEYTSQWNKIRNFGIIIIDGFQAESEAALMLQAINPDAMQMLVIENNLPFLERKKMEKNILGVEETDFEFISEAPLNELIEKDEIQSLLRVDIVVTNHSLNQKFLEENLFLKNVVNFEGEINLLSDFYSVSDTVEKELLDNHFESKEDFYIYVNKNEEKWENQILLFIENILPEMRKHALERYKDDSFKVFIVGDQLKKIRRKFSKEKNLGFLAAVNSDSKQLSQFKVMLKPFQDLDLTDQTAAMMNQIPVSTTKKIANYFTKFDDQNRNIEEYGGLYSAQSPLEYAQQSIDLYYNPRLWKEKVEKGQKLALERVQQSKNIDNFEKKCIDVQYNLQRRRAANNLKRMSIQRLLDKSSVVKKILFKRF